MEDGCCPSSREEQLIFPSPSPPPPESEKRTPGGWRTIKYIIGNETFEKLAYMSLIANLAVYLTTKYNLGGIVLINVISIWSGSSNITAILGAIIADNYLGRFRTLLLGTILSLMGMLLMTLTAGMPELRPPNCLAPPDCIQPRPWQFSFLLIALTFLALGAGAIRPCNIAFGADQFDANTDKGRAQLESFFNWWYFSFTVALMVALTVVVYIQTNISWTLGFAIPAVCLFMGIVTFVWGYHTYVLAKPQGSVFVDMAKVIVAACRKCQLDANSGHPIHDPPLSETSQLNSKLPQTDRFKFLDKAAMLANTNELDDRGMAKNNWQLCSLQQVESLKMLVGMVPVWLSGIFFLMLMDQHNTLGILQAVQTNKVIGGSFNVPPAWIGLSSMITVSIWILLYERVWVSQARKLTGKNKRMSMKSRFNVGIIFSIICPIAAGLVEKKRRELALKDNSFESPMSIALLLPQFSFSGLIEAFGAVALMEFLSTELPESMRTVSGAIFFLSLSMASYLNSVLLTLYTNQRTIKAQPLGLAVRISTRTKWRIYFTSQPR